jgi:hypothetical protein
MYQINSFTFTQPGEHAQVAVSEGGVPLGETIMLCQSGDPICVFKTYLNNDFFDEGIPIQGKGEFRLQYGDERVPVFDTEDGVNPAVAGTSVREFSFTITLDDPPPGRNSDGFGDGAENWWDNTPIFLRFLYILAIIIIILLCLICFLLLLCGVPDVFNKKANELEDEEFFKDAPFIPPNAVRSGVQDNPDFCNALANPEEYYADPNAEYVPNQSRSMPNEDLPEDEPVPLLALTNGESNRSFRGGPSEEPSESSFFSNSPGTAGGKPKVSTSGRAPRPVGKKRDPSLSLPTDAPEEAPGTSGRNPRKSRNAEASNISQTPDELISLATDAPEEAPRASVRKPLKSKKSEASNTSQTPDELISLATDAPEEAPEEAPRASVRKPRKSKKSEASNTSQTPDELISLVTDAPEEAAAEAPPTSVRKPRKSKNSEASNTSQTPDEPSKKKKKSKKKSSRISKMDEDNTNEE